jgi:hypothetical protein
MKFVRMLEGSKSDHGIFIEQMTLTYFMKKTLIKKLMIKFLFGKFINFRATRKLINEFTVPPTIFVLTQLNPFHKFVSYDLQNDF